MKISFPEGWNPEKLDGSLSSTLANSVVDDAINTNGWRVEGKKFLTFNLPETKTERKDAVKKILDSRVREQFEEESIAEKFLSEFEEVKKYILSPDDFPSSVEHIVQLFGKIELVPVETKHQKNLFKFFRHSWRLPFNTTPGRTLSFLVQSELDGQKIVVGIFSLASPAMWMGSRDEAWGYEKFDRLKVKTKSAKNRSETKQEWISRWNQIGLVDDVRPIHPNSGWFSVKEFFKGVTNVLKQRIYQFPVVVFHDRVDLQERSVAHGIILEKTTPIWITHSEPESSKADKDRKEKRRRIVENCLDALDVIDAWSEYGLPESVDALYDSIHSKGKLCKERLKAVKYGLREAKTKRISGDLAEMVICGAVPPLNKLRVGKLISMLALSNKTRASWNQKYSGARSTIASALAGKDICKPVSLSSISTTGLYGSSNVQYSRVRVPLLNKEYIRWKMVGVTGKNGSGPSNLMLSKRSWSLVDKYVRSKNVSGVSGKFGEGSNARIRRMKSAFTLIDEEFTTSGLCSEGEMNALLTKISENPHSRSVHVANLSKNSVRYNLNIDSALNDFDDNLTVESIVDYWKERWLIPYLSKDAKELNKIIEYIQSIDLKKVYPPFIKRD